MRPKSSERRDSPKRDNNNADSIQAPRSHALDAPSAALRSWRPDQAGRHDVRLIQTSPDAFVFGRLTVYCLLMSQSPLYGGHRKRPNTIDSTTSSDAAFALPKQHASPSRHQEQRVSKPTALGPAALRASSLSVQPQPPRTPQGASHAPLEADGGLSAAQRVRMELSAHVGASRAGSGSRSNSSEDVLNRTVSSPVYDEYDEGKNGPRSCPSTFNDGARSSPGRRRQLRSGELVVSKLLPTRDSVNSLLTYLHELQISSSW